MSTEPSSAPEKASLEIDLALSFGPDWAKDTGAKSAEDIARMAQRHAHDDERPARGGHGRRDDRRDDRRGPRPDRDRERRPARGPGAPGAKRGDRRNDRRDDRRGGPRRPEHAPRPEPTLTGWEAIFRPRGGDALVKQIRTTAKAYPLFDLARLVLEKSERYLVELNRKAEDAPALFQLLPDGSVWLSEREAITHVLAQQIDTYYRRETVTAEPPKGNYTCVAICGMSDTLLGPPNYHDYQDKIRKLHAERFAGMPFEAYKSRIRIVREEESIQKWKDQQSQKDEFYPKDTPEGEEPVKLASLAEVEAHFRKAYAAEKIVPVGAQVVVPGLAGLHSSSAIVRQFLRHAVDELRKFPLPVAHTLSQELVAKGLQIFKAHENITYVSIARPHYLDRVTTPVSESLSGVLEYLEANPKAPRAEQWKALIEKRPQPAEGEADEREAALVKDLSWLLHEGYVIDYARRNLEAARKPKPPTERSVSKKEGKAAKPAAAVAAATTATAAAAQPAAPVAQPAAPAAPAPAPVASAQPAAPVVPQAEEEPVSEQVATIAEQPILQQPAAELPPAAEPVEPEPVQVAQVVSQPEAPVEEEAVSTEQAS